jgi:hypothetical protein
MNEKKKAHTSHPMIWPLESNFGAGIKSQLAPLLKVSTVRRVSKGLGFSNADMYWFARNIPSIFV